jgi:quercetin dioxygenase-like cupin family protein
MSRPRKSFKALLLGCVVAGSLAVAGVSTGANPPIVATALGGGTLKAPITVNAKAGAMVVNAIKVAPGGDFGWHVHGAPVAVVITSGTLTVWDPTVAGCAPQRYGKGAAFVEPAGHLHRARNLGKTPVLLYATYIGIPKGVQPNIAGKVPASCTA